MLHKANLLFYRHGTTELNSRGILQGRIDVALSSEGKEQAARLANWVKTKSVIQIYSSPLIRAVESATIVSQQLGINFVLRNELIERDYGRFDGMNRESLKAERSVLGLPNDDPTQDWYNCSYVESDEAIWNRVKTLLIELTALNQTESVLFVTHAGVIKSILHSIFNIPYYRLLCFNP